MKKLNQYIIEKLSINKDTKISKNTHFTDPAQEIVKKYLGLKYSDGVGEGGPWKVDGDSGGRYFERGAIEGQDKVFCSVYHSLDSKSPIIQIYNTNKANAKTMKTIAFYGVNCEDDYEVIKSCWPDAKLVICKDIEDLVTNIRNDYGRVSTYRNMGHDHEKDGYIYTFK